MSKFYIAYGSNLSVEQMRFRTPDAQIVGTAILNGWQLLFKQHATVEPNANRNTPVLVWKISERDEKNLDIYEGFPHYYFKKNLEVSVTPLDGGDPVELTAMVYIMADGHKGNVPNASYYRVLMDGYRELGFDPAIMEQALTDSIGKKAAARWLSAHIR